MADERHAPGEAAPSWEQLIAKAPVGLFHADAAGSYRHVNEAWCRIAGLDGAQALGSGWASAIHPEDRETVERAWRSSVNEGKPFDLEHRFRRPDGEVIWVLARASTLCDDTGAILGYAGSITNIDSRKEMEELAHEREHRFRDVANQAPVMIGVTDAEGHITFLNKTWLDFRGKTLEEEEGWAWAAGLHPDDRERTCSEMEECIARNQPYSIEYRIQDKHGRYHWIYDTAIPRIDAFGERLGYIGTAIVIDSQKRLEQRLRAELSEKEMLFREIHHRVKNNLQIISSLIYFQSRKAAGDLGEQIFNELRQRVMAISLVHEKLYQSANFAAVEFGDYLGFLVRFLRSSIIQRERVRFEVDAEPLHLPVRDASPIGMILCELLTNVGKYAYLPGEEGRCRISVRKEGSSAVIEVSDHGVGFPEGFDPRVDGHFGWDMIRALIRQLDGSIEADNAAGAHVRLCFPIAEPQALGAASATGVEDVRVPADHQAMAPAKPRIFLVEDEAVIALQIKAWLREQGFVVCGHCSRGEAALRQIPDLNPDLILMDIRLNDGSSGIEVARRLRARMDTPIIYLTAHTDAEVQDRVTASEHAGFITKPFQPEQLLESINEILESERRSPF